MVSLPEQISTVPNIWHATMAVATVFAHLIEEKALVAICFHLASRAVHLHCPALGLHHPASLPQFSSGLTFSPFHRT